MLKLPILKKVVISYLILLLVPIGCFSFLINDFYHRYVVNNVMEEQQMIATRTAEELSGLLQSLQQVNKEAKLQRMFYLKDALEMPVVFIDIRNFIRRAEQTLRLSATMYYYDLSKDQIHTAKGIYQNLPVIEEVVAKSRSMKNPVAILSGDAIHYVIPLEYASTGSLLSAIIYQIPNSYIDNLLEYISIYPDTISTVQYQERVLYQSGTPPLQPNQFYHVVSETVDGFQIAHDIPKIVLREGTALPLQMMVLSIVALFLLGLALIYYMLKKNYLPLQNIFVRLMLESDTKESLADVAVLDQTVSQILSYKQNLLTHNVQISTEYVLYRLLTTPSDGESLGVEYDQIPLSGPCYLCILMNQEALSSFPMEADLTGKAVTMKESASCLILSGKEALLVEVLKKAGNPNYIDASANAGVGTVVNSLSKLYESYLRAKLAHTEAVRLKKSVVISQEEVLEGTILYPYELIDSLDEACRTADLEQITYYTELIKSTILETSSRFLATCIFHDYLKTISLAIESLQLQGFHPVKFREEYYQKTPTKRTALVDMISEISLQVTERLSTSSRGNKTPVTVGVIKAYVQEHYLTPTFSIKRMSFDLTTSPSNLSHIFKKETGITLTEHIDQLKVEYAKNLLTYSDRSIQEISTMLGFANPSTFIRKFKSYQNLTPGDYRSKTKE